jgi:hypothetical protein
VPGIGRYKTILANYLIRLRTLLAVYLRLFAVKFPTTKRVLIRLPGFNSILHHLLCFLEQKHTPYIEWTKLHDKWDDQARSTIRAHIACLPIRPQISVVMPVYKTPEKYLRASIESVRSQLWTEWQLCIADDASNSPHVERVLASYSNDPRIQIIRRDKNGNISAATNSALKLATYDWVALLDHDDLLPEHALYRVALEILAHPEAQIIYSDEDKIDKNGFRYDPYFKPDFDEDLLLGQNMISHLGVYRRDLLKKLNGFREGYEGSQDHDLALRAISIVGPKVVRHIPIVLYHWRQIRTSSSFSNRNLNKCVQNSRKAVRDYLSSKGIDAKVGAAPLVQFCNKVSYTLPQP